MPLLKKGTEVFPPSVFSLRAEDFPWYVAYVRSRQEKALVRYLLPHQVPFYFPQREQKSRRSGRRFLSYPPLFPGYVFLRGRGFQRHVALKSNLVVKLIEVPDQDLLSAELSQLRSLQETGASLTPCPTYSAGDAVRVVDGPFTGYTGVVLRKAGLPRLVITVSMLNKSVAVELGREDVVLLPGELATRGRGRNVA